LHSGLTNSAHGAEFRFVLFAAGEGLAIVKAPLLEFKPDTPLVFAAIELKDTRHGFEVVWPKTLDKLSICAAQVGHRLFAAFASILMRRFLIL
jgi:hypothetical protein